MVAKRNALVFGRAYKKKNRYPAEVLLQVLIATAIVMLEKKVRKFELVFIATKGSEGITLLMI